jgi:uncharacterized membrane protein
MSTRDPGHCDDITFAALVTKHTGKPLVQIVDVPYRIGRASRNELVSSSSRTDDRVACTQFILSALEDHTLPVIEKQPCSCGSATNNSHTVLVIIAVLVALTVALRLKKLGVGGGKASM